MKWINLILLCLVCFCELEADQLSDEMTEMYFDDELNLDDEIEAFLEDAAEEEMESVVKVSENSLSAMPSAEQTPGPLKIKNRMEQMQVNELSNQSLAVGIDSLVAENEKMVVPATTPLDTMKEETSKSFQAI